MYADSLLILIMSKIVIELRPHLFILIDTMCFILNKKKNYVKFLHFNLTKVFTIVTL